MTNGGLQMRKTMMAAAGAALVLSAAASAEMIMVMVELSGLQEVPPNASPGSGSAMVHIDTDTGAIDITGSYTGLIAPVSAAHLHGLAPAGSNAGVLFGLTTTGGTTGTFSGNGVLSAANLAGMLNNLTYINVHTSAFPGGEIRGQVIVPAPAGLLAFAVAPFVARRRRA